MFVVDRFERVEGVLRHTLDLVDATHDRSETLVSNESPVPFSPAYSSAIERLAVVVPRPPVEPDRQRSEILLLSPAGHPPARLVQSMTLLSDAVVDNPSFSADLRSLTVEAGILGDPFPDIIVLGPVDMIIGDRTADVSQVVTSPERLGLHRPRLLRDGRRVVYLRNYSYEDHLEVCVTDLDLPTEPEGGYQDIYGAYETRRLTSDADVVWNRAGAMAVDPVSETVFFVRGHTLHDHEQVCAVDCSADASEDPYSIRSISELFDRVGGVTVSPDGSRIAFDGDGYVWAAAPDGGDLEQLDDTPICSTPAFSPDGGMAAYAARTSANSYELRVADLAKPEPPQASWRFSATHVGQVLWI